jgi:hypothetical protein
MFGITSVDLSFEFEFDEHSKGWALSEIAPDFVWHSVQQFKKGMQHHRAG